MFIFNKNLKEFPEKALSAPRFSFQTRKTNALSHALCGAEHSVAAKNEAQIIPAGIRMTSSRATSPQRQIRKILLFFGSMSGT